MNELERKIDALFFAVNDLLADPDMDQLGGMGRDGCDQIAAGCERIIDSIDKLAKINRMYEDSLSDEALRANKRSQDGARQWAKKHHGTNGRKPK